MDHFHLGHHILITSTSHNVPNRSDSAELLSVNPVNGKYMSGKFCVGNNGS